MLKSGALATEIATECTGAYIRYHRGIAETRRVLFPPPTETPSGPAESRSFWDHLDAESPLPFADLLLPTPIGKITASGGTAILDKATSSWMTCPDVPWPTVPGNEPLTDTLTPLNSKVAPVHYPQLTSGSLPVLYPTNGGTKRSSEIIDLTRSLEESQLCSPGVVKRRRLSPSTPMNMDML